MIKKWKILDSKYRLKNKHCVVRKDTVRLPSGLVVDDYFVNERPDVAIILPITKNKEIVMVRQYKHGIRKILLELPAGTFDKTKETPEHAAKRELLEETGYKAKKLKKLGEWHEWPTKDNHTVHAFLAKNVEKIKEQNLDPTEQIEVTLAKLEDAIKMVVTGKIKVSGTIATILLAQQQKIL